MLNKTNILVIFILFTIGCANLSDTPAENAQESPAATVDIDATVMAMFETSNSKETVKKDPSADTQVNITSTNAEQAVSVNLGATIEALQNEINELKEMISPSGGMLIEFTTSTTDGSEVYQDLQSRYLEKYNDFLEEYGHLNLNPDGCWMKSVFTRNDDASKCKYPEAFSEVYDPFVENVSLGLTAGQEIRITAPLWWYDYARKERRLWLGEETKVSHSGTDYYLELAIRCDSIMNSHRSDDIRGRSVREIMPHDDAGIKHLQLNKKTIAIITVTGTVQHEHGGYIELRPCSIDNID